ncbi:RHS repeat domain-containing protein [Hymenobacter sp. B81]|uniref:RHS repeat domain-containing protein n=1 Tax=Hymenobacter sp. B81 TaxID=3344878 RepID=UPI0037DCF502
MVTRTCRGIDDFASNGFAVGAPEVPVEIPHRCGTDRTAGTPDYYTYADEILKGRMDSQPDLFTFNFLGYSGSFMLDRQGKPHLITQQPLRIELLPASGWQITAPDGTRCLFTAIEKSQPLTASGYLQGVSAWYLTQVISPTNETITLQYRDYQAQLDYTAVGQGATASTRGHYHSCGSSATYGANCDFAPVHLEVHERPSTLIDGKYPRRIWCGRTRVDLYSTAGRLDAAGLHRLDSVQIKHLDDSTRYRTFRLGYGYYANRLSLQAVTEVGYADGHSQREAPYQFTYHQVFGTGSTTPFSAAIDRWGYYNGRPNMLPFVAFRDQTVNLSGADREPDSLYAKFGLLRRITYPTGGHTTFDFELHDFSNIAADEAYYLLPPVRQSVCTSQPDPLTSQPSCGQMASTGFFRITHQQKVAFEWQITGEGGLEDQEIEAVITDSLTGSYVATVYYTKSGSVSLPAGLIELPAGSYRVVVAFANSVSAFVQGTLNFTYLVRKRHAMFARQGGGTRIRRVRSYDGIDHARDLVKEYYYCNQQRTRSTGKLANDLAFSTWDDRWSFQVEGGFGWVRSRYLMRSANDVHAASGTGPGTSVGYDTVTVLQRGGDQTLKSQYTFLNKAPLRVSLGENVSENPGYATGFNYFEQNGRQLAALDWVLPAGASAWTPGVGRLVRRQNTFYTDSIVATIYGLSVAGSLGNLDETKPAACRGIISQRYKIEAYWSPRVKEETHLYDETGQAFTTTTRWRYDNLVHQQPTRQEVSTSDGSWAVTRSKYALDYAAGVGAAELLRQRHIVNVPLEQQQWREEASGQSNGRRWLGGRTTSFTLTANGNVVPQRIYQADLPAPKPSVTEPKDAAGYYTALIGDASYQPRAVLKHYSNGALAEQQLVGESPTSYLWGYHQSKPIAETTGSPAARVAFTSFEPGSMGRWQCDSVGSHRVLGGRTGRWAYRLDGTWGVRRDNLLPGEYELLFWATREPIIYVQGGGTLQPNRKEVVATVNGWQQYRLYFTLASTNSLNLDAPGGQPLLLDEVRLHPRGTQMKSLTYDPLGGVTSLTDAAGRTLTYEYDALGRLLRSRDEQGRILTEQEYHYAQP